jgi:cbb3-type cytochrome oxidase cytochrome c subunit
VTGLFVIAAMALLTYEGANAGAPTKIEMKTPARVVAEGPQAVAVFNAGRDVAAQSGCEACHKFGDNGNDGPGPPLTKVGDRVPRQAIARTLVNPTAPMPSFKNLPPEKFNALVTFLSQLK